MWLGVTQLMYFVDGILFFISARSRQEWPPKFAALLGLCGVTVHLGYLVFRGIMARRLPLTNTYETLVLFSLLIMGLCLIGNKRYSAPLLGGFGAITAALILAACSLMSPEIEPLLPSLRSNWLLFHVLSSFMGYAAFAFAFASAAGYLMLDLRFSRQVMADSSRRFSEMQDFLDWFTYRAIAFGFPLLTLGIATGAIWANTCWGSYWNWDPKETWSFITWFIYAGCMHLRFSGMRGRTSAVLAVVGFGCVVFTYLGVNFLLAGLHDYA